MRDLKRELSTSIALFIAVIFAMVLLIAYSRENVEPKKIVVDENLSYLVIKDEAKEKLAREIVRGIENNLTKEGIHLKPGYSFIQELHPVDDEYKELSNEIKDRISLYKIFSSSMEISFCLKGRVDGEYCKERPKEIINSLLSQIHG